MCAHDAPDRRTRLPGHKRLKLAGLALLVLLAVVVPFLFGPYRVSQFTLALVYAVAVLGLNLLVGYSGQISLGHGAFFAVGAYTCAILLDRTGIHYLLTIPAAALACFAAGLALGVPALRLRGLYLALVTLAIAIATPVLLRRFDSLTGGSQGSPLEQPTAPSGRASPTIQDHAGPREFERRPHRRDRAVLRERRTVARGPAAEGPASDVP